MEKNKNQLSRGLRKRIRKEKAVARSITATHEEKAAELTKRLAHMNPPLTIGNASARKEPSIEK